MDQQKNRGKYSIICRLFVAGAEDYLYYWQNDYKTSKPYFLATKNPIEET